METRVSKIIRALSKYECWGCGQRFEKGSFLRSQIDANKGLIGNSYWCKVCDKTLESENLDSFDRKISFASVCNYQSWQDNLGKYSRTYSKEEIGFLRTATKKEQGAEAIRADIRLIKSDAGREHPTAAVKSGDELLPLSMEQEKESAATRADIRLVKSVTDQEQGEDVARTNVEMLQVDVDHENETAFVNTSARLIESDMEHEQTLETPSENNKNHIKEFYKYIKSFNTNLLLNELKELNPGYDDNESFYEITDDLDSFEELVEQLLGNIENYVLESQLRKDEDKRSLYLIYSINEQENELLGVADNIERLRYSINKLIMGNIVGEIGESYDKNRFDDLNYLNTIPYLFVSERTLNYIDTNGN